LAAVISASLHLPLFMPLQTLTACADLSGYRLLYFSINTVTVRLYF